MQSNTLWTSNSVNVSHYSHKKTLPRQAKRWRFLHESICEHFFRVFVLCLHFVVTCVVFFAPGIRLPRLYLQDPSAQGLAYRGGKKVAGVVCVDGQRRTAGKKRWKWQTGREGNFIYESYVINILPRKQTVQYVGLCFVVDENDPLCPQPSNSSVSARAPLCKHPAAF